MANFSWKDFLFGENTGTPPATTRDKGTTIKRLRNISEHQRSTETIRQSQLFQHKQVLRDLKQKFRHSPEVVYTEWEAAKRAVLPSSIDLGPWEVLPSNPFTGIQQTLSSTTSLYRDQVFSRFAGNLRTLFRSGAVDTVAMENLHTVLPQPAILTKSLYQIQNPQLNQTIQQIENALGTNLTVHRRGVTGQAGELIFTQVGSNRLLFTLPEAFSVGSGTQGLVRQGSTLQNVYAAGLFAQVDESGSLINDPMTFTQYKANRILSAIYSWKGVSTGSIYKTIRDEVTEVNKLLTFMEPGIGPEDYSLETIYKANQLTAVDSQGRLLEGAAQRDFMSRYAAQLGLTPASGASRFSLMDPDELYGGFAYQSDWARKPWQFIRQFRPTPEAQAAIRGSEFGSEYWDFLDSPIALREFKGPSGARLKTLYLSDEQINKLSEMFNMPIGDGELLINSKMSIQGQVSRRRRVGLAELDRSVTAQFMNRGIKLDAINQPIRLDSPFEISGVFGRSLEGSLMATDPRYRTRLLGLAPGIGRGAEGAMNRTLDLLVEDIIDMGDAEKQFGALKGMARRTNFDRFKERIASILPLHPNEISELGAIGRLSDLRKNPALEHMQQFSAIAYQTNLSNPQRALQQIISSGNISGSIQDLAAQHGILPGTRTYEEIFGDQAIYGVTRLHFGGTKEFTGAGNIGTFEPRILTLLEGGAFKGHTDELAEQLLTRVMAAQPDRFTLHTELEKTLGSISGRFKPGSPSEVRDITSMTIDDINNFRREGGFISTGVSEIPNIYFPGYAQVPGLQPMKIGSGEMVEPSPVSKVLSNIERDIESLQSGLISSDQVLENFTKDKTGYISELARQHAIAGKGTGALTRGDLLGSRFLTALSDIGEEGSSFYDELAKLKIPDKSMVMGIPEEYGLNMFEELSGLYDSQGIENMKTRFMKGELVGGAIARHPFIGPYSMQPVLMKKVRTKDPVILVPEQRRSISVDLPDGPVATEITEGVLTGLALDKDADIAMALAFDPKLERTIRTGLTTANSPFLATTKQGFTEMQEHSLRMQLLKAKKGQRDAAADLTLNELQKMVADKAKLSVLDEEVGLVSSTLQRSRAAITSSSLDKGAQLQALGLLEWLEQQPISGKHLSQQSVLSGHFEEQMMLIRKGASGDVGALTTTVEEMLLAGKDLQTRQLNQALLGQGAWVTMGGQRRFLKGFELQKTATNISQAVKSFTSVGLGKQQAILEKLTTLKGSQSIGLQDINRFLDANSIATRPGTFSEVGRETLANINQLAASVKSKIKPVVRPLAIGLAALGAGSFLLSGSPGVLPPPPPPEGLLNAPVINMNRLNTSRDSVDIPLAQQQLGEPVAPGIPPNSTTILDTTAAARQKAFNAQIKAFGITPLQRLNLGQRLGANFGGTINININDSTRTLNHRAISDMLEEG